MQLVRGLHNLRSHHRGCVLTIGNYDGLHLGHQAMLRTLQEQGQRLNVPTAVMCFEPSPLEYLNSQRPGATTPAR